MKHDIRSRTDIEALVNAFYGKVQASAELGYIFDDVAHVDWPSHLPRMYSFWATLLLGEQSFRGNPMLKHIELSRVTPLTGAEFEEWLRLFTETVDGLFEGEVAEEAKARAGHIARLMLHKIEAA